MIRKIVSKFWKILPPAARLRIVRITQPTFTVSAAAIIVNENREVLLLNHVLRPLSGWGLPGGFVGKGEQPEDAIRREIREETGIELTSLKMFRVRIVRSHVEILFTAKPDGVPQVLSGEILDLGWFIHHNAPAKMSSAQLAIIAEVLNSDI